MAKEDFLISVRTALGTVLPRVDADYPYTDRQELEEIFRRSTSDLWLTKSAVAGFDRDDFDDLPIDTLDVLGENISEFIKVASGVNPNGPATKAQFNEALPRFLKIAEIVREYTRDDWLKDARDLIDQAARWAEAETWPTVRYAWELNEPFLGAYELDRLIYAVMGSQMALVPVGRFMMRSRGSFDLAVMPAYESVSIKRMPSGRWMIGPVPGGSESLTWKQQHFVEVSKKLARMG